MPIFTPFGPSVCKLGLPNAVAGYYRTTYIPRGEEVYNNLKHINKLNVVSDGVYFYTFKISETYFKGFLNVFH
jgi:hypothetical protein